MNFPKSELYNDVAEWFQREGFTAMVYDPRGVGASDGSPRNEINPAKQTEDIHDAVTFLKSLPAVDPKRIAVWGYSLGAAESLAAAAVDPRIKLVVAICPSGNPWGHQQKDERNRVLARVMRDRESRLRGNSPFEVPFIGESEASIFNIRVLRGRMSEQPYEAVRTGLAAVDGYRNVITVQTLLHMASWNIMELMPMISPTPVFLILADEEEIQRVKQGGREIYEALGEPKQLHVEPDRGHLDILTNDERFPAIMKRQVDYLMKYFGE
jgi:pimeloyl-ACP methyl ester carboxylesterase